MLLQAPAQFSRVFWFLSHTCPLVQTKVCTLLAKAIAAEDMHISEYRDRHPQWTYTMQMYLLEDAQIHQRIEAIASILKPLHRTGLTTELQTFV